VALELRLEQHLDRPLNKPLIFSPAMDLTTPRGRSGVRMLRLVNREARHEQGLLGHPLAAKSIEAALVDGLLLAQPHNYSDALLHGTCVAPPRAVREAIELLETYPDRAWSAPALASQVHVSVRALQEGFQRALDTTPMRYLRDVRLRRVQEDLLRQPPTSQQSAQLFNAGEFSIRADSSEPTERDSAKRRRRLSVGSRPLFLDLLAR
jgi:AraC-like DNA-binding protein